MRTARGRLQRLTIATPVLTRGDTRDRSHAPRELRSCLDPVERARRRATLGQPNAHAARARLIQPSAHAARARLISRARTQDERLIQPSAHAGEATRSAPSD